MSLHVSDPYAHIVDKARWSHAHGRNVSHILAADVDAARLFCYGYRSQTIGAFHATRVAIEAEDKETGPYVDTCLYQARVVLEELEAKAVDPVVPDHRALISTLYAYDQWTNVVVEVLGKASARGTHPRLESIRNLFLQNIQKVTAGNGLYIARDLELPEQGSFVVPDLDISIAPIIYGDNHSWNAAFLAGNRPGVSVHRHHQGAEIHLGYSPVSGHTILGDSFSEVNEGYAMPIPPMTDHGFFNTSGHDHVVPFVFGSTKLAGWGVFFDVEPRPGELVKRKEQPLESEAMNHSVFLEREIAKMKTGKGFSRQVLVPAHRAGSEAIGGLELALTRAGRDLEIPSDHYRIVSIQSGKARIRIGEAEAEVGAHDHFGIPADMECTLTPRGEEPVVFLDAMLLPVNKSELDPLENLVSTRSRA
ncbi:MAG TPA: hypothetical protein VH088_24615 [Terriglobales bacterium]|jgi:hypothetical protein|nr:hypothetical protein [Terriglobales bacterium]